MTITTPILIALLLIAVLLSILTPIALWLAFIHWQSRRYERKWKAVAEQKQMAAEAAMTALKKYLSENETNTLAKANDNVQNTSNQPGTPMKPVPALPFFSNKEKLLAAKARLEEVSSDNHGIPELGTLTHMDAWREVDSALLDLNERTNDG